MATIRLDMRFRPELKNPVLVGGIPDSGFVAKLAMDHIIKELNAQLFAEIYSYSFPAQVLIKPDGTVDLPRNELYFWKSSDSDRDLVLFTGDTQPNTPQGAYEICDRVLEVAQSLGVKRVYTVGAYIMGSFVDKPKVYGTATEVQLLDELKNFGIQTMDSGSVTWMNGLLFGLTTLRGMQGVFLSSETSGYVVDPKAGQAVLEALGALLKIKIDMAALEKRAKETEALIKTMEAYRRTYEKPSDQPPPSEVYR